MTIGPEHAREEGLDGVGFGRRRSRRITAGTIFDKTRTPLTTLFEAAWHVTTAKNGLSAKTQERTLGIRYRVAWVMLQRFRVAMVRSERDQLSGAVEVGGPLVGGAEHGGKRSPGRCRWWRSSTA